MTAQIPVSREMIMNEVKSYIHDDDDLALIEKAYDYAAEKHKDQRRRSGEPYFVHLQQVAYVLTTLRVGPQTIAAGLLHDVMEDCGVPKEELAAEFDDDIANLVESVTKIGNIEFKDIKEYQAANHRKIFIAMAKDVRVIIIKLVDRLHNMRTLQYMAPEKQQRIARETLDVYAPIAHRMGISVIENELEDLCFFYLNPDKYHEIAHMVEMKKTQREAMVNKMIVDIKKMLDQYGFSFRIFGRSKHLYSIYKKMVEKNKTFDEIFDLYAIRIVTQTELNCYEILGYIHAQYKPMPNRLKDYIAMPKSNMYQSLHTTIMNDQGNVFEIQIRTEEMDRVAEQGVAAHWRYKEGVKYSRSKEQKEIEEKLSWYHDLIAMTNDTETKSSELMDVLQKDIFEANVYVMSPKGRVIELPNGSTPIDFAYRIHTDVGNQAVGAMVNGVLVPLKTPLKTGDIVTIKTSKQSAGPSEDWLKIVKSATAHNKIKAFLSKKETEDRKEAVEKGEKMLNDELRRRSLDPAVYMDKQHMDNLYAQMDLGSYNELMYAISAKSVSMVQLVEKLTNQKTTSPLMDNMAASKMFSPKTVRRQVSSAGVVVEGIDSIKVALAGCCMPVYGDDIVGYITMGQGVTVHRRDCPNIAGEKKRLIDVSWDTASGNKEYETWLRLDADDRNFLISDIVTLAAQLKAPLIGINAEMMPDKIHCFVVIKIRVKTIDQLTQVMANMRKISGVNDVLRITK